MPIHLNIIDKLFEKATTVEKVSNAKMVAAIVYKGDIVAEGSNSYKTHPFQKKYAKNSDSICLHAEINATIKAIKMVGIEHINKCDLYVVRARKTEKGSKYQWGNAKPCSGCSRMISALGIKSVYFTTNQTDVVDYL